MMEMRTAMWSRQLIRWKSTITDSSVRRLRRSSRSLEETVSFEDFVLKGQVLHVYRDMLRSVNKIPDVELRKEVLDYLKGEFKATKDVQSLDVKRSLLIGGIRQFKSVSNNMGLSYTDIKF